MLSELSDNTMKQEQKEIKFKYCFLLFLIFIFITLTIYIYNIINLVNRIFNYNENETYDLPNYWVIANQTIK